MAEKRTKAKKSNENTNEKYLSAVFNILKKKSVVSIIDNTCNFNDTELRLLGEIFSAKQEGVRLISTQLATRLAVTRSAVSQMVNRLEGMGVLERVPDEVDKKIAYIEITEKALTQYREDIEKCGDFVARVVHTFGEDRFNDMCEAVEEFVRLIEWESERSKPQCRKYKVQE